MITNPENALALVLVLLWQSDPGMVEHLHRVTTVLSLEGAGSDPECPEAFFQDLQQLSMLFGVTRSLPPPVPHEVSLADVRALLAALRRGDAR